MKQLRKMLQNRSIQSKLNRFFLFLTIVPFILLGLITANLVSRLLIRQNTIVTEQYLERAAQAIDKSLGELESIQVSGNWDQSLVDALSNAEHSVNAAERTSRIGESLRNIANTQKDITAILLTDQWGNSYSYSLYLSNSEMDKIQKEVESRTELLTDFHKGKALWSHIPDAGNLVAGSRRLFNAVDMTEYGTSILILDPYVLQSQFETLKTTPGSFFVVYDYDHQVVLSNCGWDIQLGYDNLLSDTAESNRVMTEHGQLYRSEREIVRLGWTVAFFTPVQELMQNVYSMQLLIMGIIFFHDRGAVTADEAVFKCAGEADSGSEQLYARGAA